MTNKITDIFKKVDIRSTDECWPWLGRKSALGYGRIDIGNVKGVYAHRAAYLLLHPGEIELRTPSDKNLRQFVLHTCDNGSCCNPAHLYLGNYADNMKDKTKRKRCPYRKGELGPNAKLTNVQADDIRWIASKGIASSEIADVYGVSKSCIQFVISYRTFYESNVNG